MSPKAKKDEATEETASKASNKIIECKISKDELLSLQKEGRLCGYDPRTGIGRVKSIGNKITFPEGKAEIV